MSKQKAEWRSSSLTRRRETETCAAASDLRPLAGSQRRLPGNIMCSFLLLVEVRAKVQQSFNAIFERAWRKKKNPFIYFLDPLPPALTVVEVCRSRFQLSKANINDVHPVRLSRTPTATLEFPGRHWESIQTRQRKAPGRDRC